MWGQALKLPHSHEAIPTLLQAKATIFRFKFQSHYLREYSPPPGANKDAAAKGRARSKGNGHKPFNLHDLFFSVMHQNELKPLVSHKGEPGCIL